MKKGLTELVFILDKSGSMGGLESDTIGGFNSMLKKQREEKGECRVTTVLFDNAENAIECTIDVNEMMGSELHLHLSSKNDDKIIVRLPTVDLTKEQRNSLSFGNKLYITFPAKVMHLFDPATEKSLIDG